MAELQREKNVLDQLVKAREAVKRKYDLLKFEKADVEKTLSETFKPIVDPLEKLIIQSKQEKKSSFKRSHQNQRIASDNESSDDDNVDDGKQISRVDKSRFNNPDSTLEDNDISSINLSETMHNFETADEKSELSSSSINIDEDQDKIYGVRKTKEGYIIGNTPIGIEKQIIEIANNKYPRTKGLDELLFNLHPDQKSIKKKDLDVYKKILVTSSAHKRRYHPHESIRRSTSHKFKNIIGPLFASDEKKGEGLLPRYKIARSNARTDYVYWDDPNELVDRLRLIVAERSAGNHSHENEIHSIIEELREGGYIY